MSRIYEKTLAGNGERKAVHYDLAGGLQQSGGFALCSRQVARCNC